MYRNMKEGETYTVKGYLVDKTTGERIFVDGEPVTAETEFTTDSQFGSIDTRFTLNTAGLGGKMLVVFEEVYDSNGMLVAEHKDINDENQTITITTMPPPHRPPTPQTGDDIPILPIFILFGVSVIGLGFLIWRKRKNR